MEEFALVYKLPEGEKFVCATLFQDKVFVATERSVFVYDGKALVPVQIYVESLHPKDKCSKCGCDVEKDRYPDTYCASCREWLNAKAL